MTLLINPGSRIHDGAVGWTNSLEGARLQAAAWLDKMRAEGFGDVEVREVGQADGDTSRWRFAFRHTVTGVVVFLDTHGIDNIDAYIKQALFEPRVYWNGSSSSNPSMDDFAAPGFVMTFRAVSDE
jgi:hypothetical protein